jgi:hypothetical protein
MSNLMSFHKVLPACEEGSVEAWQAFLGDYSPAIYELFRVYLPLTREEQDQFWRAALVALTGSNFERLRGFEHQAEREFLVDLRAFVLDRALTQLDPSMDATLPPQPTVETLAELLKGLPLLHQEIVFLTLAGYSHASLEKLLRITPTVAQQGLERLKTQYAPLLSRSEDRCLWPAGWTGLTRSLRAAQQENCASLRQLIRILDGQVSWYDKSPVEEHRSACFHCLELWTSLLEVVHWKRQARPWAPAQFEPFLACLPLRAGPKSRRSVFARLFGK